MPKNRHPNAASLWLAAVPLAAASLLAAACSSPGGGETPDWSAYLDGAGASSGGDAVGSGGDATPVSDVGGVPDGAGSGADVAPDVGPPLEGPPCGSHKICQTDHPGTPYCDATFQVCVQCLIDFQCKDTTNHCELGKCAKLSCKPGHKQCKGDFVEVCNAAGDEYDIDVCPDAKPVCQAGNCLACKPGATFCKKPEPGGKSLAVLQCNADGSASDIKTLCSGQQVCHDGTCALCVPGAKQCGGDTAQICATDGSAWQTLDDCGAKGLTCLGGLCVNPCSGDFKSNTNVGCDYWAVDLDNAVEGTKNATDAQFAVVITNTSDKPTKVTVELMATTPTKTATYQVAGGALKIINLPDPAWKVSTKSVNQEGSGINNRVYNIKADQPIVAYQFNPLSNVGVFSNDASLLLPRTSLGKNYYVMSRKQINSALRSYFTVIAVEPGPTKVDVWVTSKTLAGPGVPALNKGQKATYTLQRGQVLNIESNDPNGDLTDSVVKADKRVAVFGGSEASFSPDIGNCVPYALTPGKKVCAGTSGGGISTIKYCNKHSDCAFACCADHLEEQLFPVKAWGTTYVGAHLRRRGIEKDTWRVVAAQNGTTVTVTPNIGIAIPALTEGKFYEFHTDKDFVLQASGPIMVAQYMASSYQTVTAENPACTSDAQCKSQYGFDARCTSSGFSKYCAPIGDPSLLLNMATSQYLDNYIFLVPDKYKLNFVSIVAEAGTQVTMDGLSISAAQFAPVSGTKWTVARLPIAINSHKINASKPVGVWVYGYDNYVSYGYAAGAKLGGD